MEDAGGFRVGSARLDRVVAAILLDRSCRNPDLSAPLDGIELAFGTTSARIRKHASKLGDKTSRGLSCLDETRTNDGSLVNHGETIPTFAPLYGLR